MYKILSMSTRYAATVLSLLFVLSGCDKEQNNEPEINPCLPTDVPGELEGVQFIMTITSEQVEGYISSYFPFLEFEFEEMSVDIYSMSYKTRDKNNDLTPVSGVMFLPVGRDTLDLVSTQHGTAIRREDVGSQNPFMAFDGLLMALKGSMVVAPDYIGLGDSQLLHPYLHAQLSANAVVDMLRAGRAYACDNSLTLTGDIFLSGYSEGGYVALATQKIIETQHTDEFDLMGVAPMAGPFDLLGTTRSILSQDDYENPAFLAYLVTAYNDIYEWDRLGEIFQEPYASMIPGLFNGTVGADSINSQLSHSLDTLFTQDFRQSILTGNETLVEAALIENSFEDWGPIAPVRLIHGTADEVVPYENSEVVYQSMVDNGGVSVELVPLPGADHVTGALFAYDLAAKWYVELSSQE